MTPPLDARSAHTAETRGDLFYSEAEIADAIDKQRCNGCGQPRAEWGPVCPGMTQGDWTHYHSPEWWRQVRR